VSNEEECHTASKFGPESCEQNHTCSSQTVTMLVRDGSPWLQIVCFSYIKIKTTLSFFSDLKKVSTASSLMVSAGFYLLEQDGQQSLGAQGQKAFSLHPAN